MTLSELVLNTYRAFKPPKRQTVSEWADENRVLVSDNCAEPGPWRTSRAPYQKEPMDAFTQPGIWKIIVMSSSQVGKTELELNMMGRAICVDPGPILFVEPTKEVVDDYSKRRVAPMIRACKPLAERVYEAKSRDAGNTITMKTFPGGSMALVGANSAADLSSKPVRYVFLDEVDRFPKSAGTEGDPTELAIKRTETFRHNRKIVLTSTPTIKGASKIEREYKTGTQEEWHVECPHCRQFSYIRFADIKFQFTEYTENGEKGYNVQDAHWRCPVCKRTLTEYETKRCAAKWVVKNKKALANGVRSFRMNAFMSPWSDWKSIVLQFLEAQDDTELLKVFYNTVLGETWELRDRSGVPEKLHARREHYNAEVPTGVLVLTMGVDTQDNRLEFEIVGWNREEESWGILRGVIPGRADADGVWDELDNLLDREWKMKNGGTMRIMTTFIDSGGHFTEEVYKQCAKRAVRRVYAIKGEGGEGKAYVRMMKKSGKGGDVRFLISVDSGKEAILYATTREMKDGQPESKYMHFPIEETRGYTLDFFRGLVSEKPVVHRRGGKSVIVWEKTYERNEPLDCRNYARASYKYFNWNFDKLEAVLSGKALPKPVVTTAQKHKQKNKRVISSGIKV